MNDTLTANPSDLWWQLDDTTRDQIKAWLADHGIDTADTFQVRLLAEGAIEAIEGVREPRGPFAVVGGEILTRRRIVSVPDIPDAWPL